MFKTHLIVAWRSISKHKLQTVINIGGLAIGLAGCLVVYLLTRYEMSFNKDIVDGDRIYRVVTQYNGPFSGVNSGVPTGVFQLAASSVQGTDVQCPLQVYSTHVAIPSEHENGGMKKLGEQKDLMLTDPEFFDLIQNYEWLVGSPRQSLSEPFQLVLTESKVKQYFGLKEVHEALGRQVIYDDSLRMTVTGVLRDPDFNSDFHFTDILSRKTISASFLKDEFPIDEWGGTRSADQFFVKASEGISIEALLANLKPLNDRFNRDASPEDDKSEFKLQPLSDLHFNQEFRIFDNSRAPAHKPTLYGLMMVAGLLLVIAGINFVNLATVQATRRAKETGVRKVIGASRHQITGQFLVETFLITLLALPVAVALAELAMKWFSEFMPDGLVMNVFVPGVLVFLVGSVIAITFLAGLYPSFVLSAFQPAFAIKNQTSSSKRSTAAGLRKGLIVFQFVLAQTFIIVALVMGRQMHFMLQKDLGFDKSAIVYFYTGWGGDKSQKFVFQEKLMQMPLVKGTTVQNMPPMNSGAQISLLKFEQNEEQVEAEVHFRMVDTAYLRLYGIELLAGQNLLPSDTMKELLVNETLARHMGFERPEDAVGKTVTRHTRSLPIAGVVKDFHVQSMHHKIPPLAITANTASAYSVAAKISTEQSLSAGLDQLKSAWQEVYPTSEFHPYFLDETLEKMYESEVQTIKLINTATGLAIFISCLGLFGLAFFTVTQRTKEISVRKILGASVAGIVGLLSKDFLLLVLLSLIIASPIAWVLIDQWLTDFAYRIAVPWYVFLMAGTLAVLVAFLMVGLQSIKAALANPVENLRSE